MLRSTLFPVTVLLSALARAEMSSNYSVQLMAGLAPAGWSDADWAAASDAMIGKTQAYILTDLLEDLAISLKAPEDEIRAKINQERTSIDLPILPPPADKPSRFGLQTRYFVEDPERDYSTYLPPGWSESNFRAHKPEHIAYLPAEVLDKLALRFEAEKANPNKGFLEEFSDRELKGIGDQIHDFTRKAMSLPSGVRAYKRSVAPLVATMALQGYEEFGFLFYRTTYKDQKTWAKAQEHMGEIFDAQFGGGFYGEGVDDLRDRLLVLFEEDASALEGASISDVRAHFKAQKEELPPGLKNSNLILLIDEPSMRSLADLNEYPLPFIWAIDTSFDPDSTANPAGYQGAFKVRPAALVHHLYVAVASGVYSPVEVWEKLQRKLPQPPPPTQAATWLPTTPRAADVPGMTHNEL